MDTIARQTLRICSTEDQITSIQVIHKNSTCFWELPTLAVVLSLKVFDHERQSQLAEFGFDECQRTSSVFQVVAKL